MNSKRHRSAVTGEYVTAEQAKADPERTVSERGTGQMDASELSRLIREMRANYEAELFALRSQVQTLESAVAALQAGK